MSLQNPAFNDNAVPFGSRVEVFNAGTTTGTYCCESITLTYPTQTIERKDQIGGPNGFVLVPQQPTGSCTVQIPTVTADGAANALQVGAYFTDTFAGASQKWVVSSVSPAYEQLGYRKYSVNLVQALYS